MRILTIISGILLASGGAFCFLFSSNAFSDMAFVIGLVMIAAGALTLIAYIVSGRAERLPDTLLVESIVSVLFGFAVLNNQVPNSIICVFFGAWLTLAGANRLSQSISVSRFNPKDWFRILPLAALCTLLGAAMMMPTLVSTINSLVLSGSAFVLNGLSLMMYAMYMKQPEGTSAEKAKERAEMKKAAAKAKREQRKKLRSLSEKERNEAIAAERKAKRKAKLEKRLAAAAEKKAREDAKRDPKDVTHRFTEEEMRQIAQAAERKAKAKSERAQKAGAEPEKRQNPEPKAERDQKTKAGPENNQTKKLNKKHEIRAERKPNTADKGPFANRGTENSSASKTNRAESMNTSSEKTGPWPAFRKPDLIPSLRKDKAQDPVPDALKAEAVQAIKRTAVNIEDVESGKNAVKFDPVELPEVRFAADEQSTVNRAEVLDEIGRNAEKEPVEANYTPVSLEELVNEPLPKRLSESEDVRRFTKTFAFNWEDAEKILGEPIKTDSSEKKYSFAKKKH